MHPVEEVPRRASSASVEDWGSTIDLAGIKSLVGPIENHSTSLFLLSNFFPPRNIAIQTRG